MLPSKPLRLMTGVSRKLSPMGSPLHGPIVSPRHDERTEPWMKFISAEKLVYKLTTLTRRGYYTPGDNSS